MQLRKNEETKMNRMSSSYTNLSRSDGAPERGPVVGLGRHQAEDRSGRLVTIFTSDDGRIQKLGCPNPVPLDLRRRGSSLRWAGEVQWSSFSWCWRWWFDLRWRGWKQNSEVKRLGVQDPAGASFLDPALELAVVPVVGGVGDAKIVSASVGQMVDAVKYKFCCKILTKKLQKDMNRLW